LSENLFEMPPVEERCNIQQVWSTVRLTYIACIDTRREELIQVLQERYGWTREEAVTELDRRLDMYARIRLG
jgi:hypothetical protein